MIPGNARPAHRRLRQKLAELAQWNEEHGPNEIGSRRSRAGDRHFRRHFHARSRGRAGRLRVETGLTYPLPLEKIRRFAAGVERCLVIEEGDPYLVEQLRAAGIAVEGKHEMYRFGELNVARVRRIIAGDTSPEPAAAPGKPPAFCQGCPHRDVFGVLKKLDCIVAGDIGCYSLGALPPWEAMDSLVCMGASIGMGLGLRHALPAAEARRVVSVLGDSTFVHSGIPGLVEMVYNPPPGGHVVLILDNSTTAMTGLQEHPGTGRTLDHAPTGKIVFEDLVRSLGIPNVKVVDPVAAAEDFEQALVDALSRDTLSVIITRRTCLLAAARSGSTRHASLRRKSFTPCPSPRGRGENRMSDRVVNIVVAGLGGQGVLTASTSDGSGLRCRLGREEGRRAWDEPAGRIGPQRRPLRPPRLQPHDDGGRCHFLVVLAQDQVEPHRDVLRPGGTLLVPDSIAVDRLPNRRSINVALLGVLSRDWPSSRVSGRRPSKQPSRKSARRQSPGFRHRTCNGRMTWTIDLARSWKTAVGNALRGVP